jgi:hypothetical protein
MRPFPRPIEALERERWGWPCWKLAHLAHRSSDKNKIDNLTLSNGALASPNITSRVFLLACWHWPNRNRSVLSGNLPLLHTEAIRTTALRNATLTHGPQHITRKANGLRILGTGNTFRHEPSRVLENAISSFDTSISAHLCASPLISAPASDTLILAGNSERRGGTGLQYFPFRSEKWSRKFPSRNFQRDFWKEGQRKWMAGTHPSACATQKPRDVRC